MSTAEQFRLLLFICLVVSVYVLATGVVFRGLQEKHEHGRPVAPLKPSIRWWQRVVLSLACIGALCFAYGYFVEPYWLSVTHVSIHSAKVPAGTPPIRVVHISDIHSDPQARLEERLPPAIAAQKPDLIVFTGDALNSPEGLPVFKKLMTALAPIAPTFAVRGNWDTGPWRQLPLFEGTQVRELDGTAQLLHIRGVPISVGGVAMRNEAHMTQAFGADAPHAFKIFLYHTPDLIHEASANVVDLYCAGHTHGGQVALPFYGALVTFSKFGKQFEAGLYREQILGCMSIAA